MNYKILFRLFLFLATPSLGQNYHANSWTISLDSLLDQKTKKQFNGVVLISQNGKSIYSNVSGYANLETKPVLKFNDQFVVGSISKQFTAVLVLREFERNSLELFVPIYKYLPELTANWAKTVTIHDLLTHTHGITELNKPTKFQPGSQFLYSQLGYYLLAKILERTSGKPFAKLSAELFKHCSMTKTFHPYYKEQINLVNGYTESLNGKIEFEKNSLENYPAAGSFISTAKDLTLWNSCLHNGRLLNSSTYKLMVEKKENATRDHPIFGKTEYGYGITIDDNNNLKQLGLTGYAPGFVSLNFFYPETGTSVIVLENITYDTEDIRKTFHFHTEVLRLADDSIRKIISR